MAREHTGQEGGCNPAGLPNGYYLVGIICNSICHACVASQHLTSADTTEAIIIQLKPFFQEIIINQ